MTNEEIKNLNWKILEVFLLHTAIPIPDIDTEFYELKKERREAHGSSSSRS